MFLGAEGKDVKSGDFALTQKKKGLLDIFKQPNPQFSLENPKIGFNSQHTMFMPTGYPRLPGTLEEYSKQIPLLQQLLGHTLNQTGPVGP